MKTLSEFYKENNSVPKNCLMSIIGGTTVTSEKSYKGTDGCMHHYTDEFEDCDGDGIWNRATEIGEDCMEIEC